MAKKLKKREPIATFLMSVNGVKLAGEKYADGWYWFCLEFPQIARDFNGSDTTTGAVDTFMANILRPAHELKRAFIEIG